MIPPYYQVDFSACRLPKTYIRAAEAVVRAPFAAAVRLDGYTHCAGVRPAEGDFAYDQAVSCLAGLASILRQAGTGPERVYALTAGVSERDLPALEKALAGWGGKEDMVREADFSARPCGPWLMELACSAAAPVPSERG
ncbi:MAG: hypothetical protein LBL37_04080 [Gracilibacteraceae bacterium]|jgi:enamine deaminase RidA (YjgF/YER057c/UK114 family)|nr:hypothetical protein [Gracilibacteraceae bacterium]